jgi:predicted O-linked N-acetylglucosamine transferase (SPINDLY family)
MLAGIVPFLSRNDFEVGIFFAASRPGVLPYHNPNDRIQTMLKQRADFTRDIVWTSLAAIQREIEQYRLDILVYPAIGMEPMTYFLAHSRLARVQLATHGHASTTGIASSIDFFVSYKSFEVASAQKHYSERLVTVRGLVRYPMPLVPRGGGGSVHRTLGLPRGSEVFIVPQTSQKISPVFDLVWKRILQRIPTARIVMKKPYVYERPDQSAVFTRLLRDRMATVFGDEALFSRLVFIDAAHEGEWFDLFRGAVAMLDSYPFGGYTSTLEALSLGLPVVTLPHVLMAGRCTAAFLRVCQTPELIATDIDEFVERAERIARNKTFSRSVQDRIHSHRQKLFAEDAGNDAVHGWSRLLKEVNIGLAPSDLHGTEEDRQLYGLWGDRHDVGTSVDHRISWKLGIPQHCSAPY